MDEKDKKWQSPIVHDLVTLYLMSINKKNHKEKEHEEHAPLKEKLSEEKHTTNISDFLHL